MPVILLILTAITVHFSMEWLRIFAYAIEFGCLNKLYVWDIGKIKAWDNFFSTKILLNVVAVVSVRYSDLPLEHEWETHGYCPTKQMHCNYPLVTNEDDSVFEELCLIFKKGIVIACPLCGHPMRRDGFTD